MKNITDTILKTRAPFYALAFAVLLGIAGANVAQAAEYQEGSSVAVEMNHTHGNGHTHDDQPLDQRAGD
ncbi:MAG: hypothetical protein RIB80_12880 [Rhodospirillales bacterium]|tara:strand:- start:47 stop:253 length:207 start_codon:yes stop_codon:yes gene_type:complete